VRFIFHRKLKLKMFNIIYNFRHFKSFLLLNINNISSNMDNYLLSNKIVKNNFDKNGCTLNNTVFVCFCVVFFACGRTIKICLKNE